MLKYATGRRSARAVEARRQVALPGLEQPAELGGERRIGRERGQAGAGRLLQDQPGVARDLPGLGIDVPPQVIGLVAPDPAQVEGEIGERFEARGQVRRCEGAQAHAGPLRAGAIAAAGSKPSGSRIAVTCARSSTRSPTTTPPTSRS